MGKKKHHILIVDDDPNIRMLLEFLLRKEYRVATRADGLSGLAYLSLGELPDLIILDINMPEMNGYEVLCRIRESGLYRNIPIIMLSGFEENEVKQTCISKGLCDYMVKPFNPEKIFEGIERFLIEQSPIQTQT